MPLELPVAVTPEDWQQGPEDAPHALVVYGDYQCEDTQVLNIVLRRLREEVADRFRLVWRHLPLTDEHPQSLSAAKAAEAAGRLGSFWPMHEALFDLKGRLRPTDILAAARQVGLNAGDFAARWAESASYQAVLEDVEGIRRAGAHSTPTVFLDARLFEEPPTLVALRKALELGHLAGRGGPVSAPQPPAGGPDDPADPSGAGERSSVRSADSPYG